MKPMIIKASVIAAAITLLPFGAQAAGLGQFTVQSKLGEPLNVEIQINATQQELQSLSARIAPSDAFLQANIPYASFVPNVRITVENRGDRSVLKLRTDTPVNEAVASLIVQLNWDDGRVARTYNILLDPPDLAIRPPVPVQPTVVVAQPASPPPVVEPASPPPVQAQVPPPLPVPAPEPAPVPVPEPAPAPAPAPEPTPAAPAPEPAPARALDLGDDPVFIDYQSRSELEIVQEEVVASPAERPAPAPAPTPTPTAERAAPPLPMPSPAPTYMETQVGNYTVVSGDTLGAIASRRMPVDVTLDQMMMALYRSNQTAFIGNNINRLKAGAILKIPTADEVRSTSQAEARREVRVQTREFNEWRARLASEVVARPANQVEESTGRTRSIDAVPPPSEQNRDRVEIASTEPGQGDTARLRELEENLAAARSSLEEKTDRVRDLEEITRKQEELLAKNREIARLQQQTAASAPTEPVVAETPPPAPAPVVEELVAPEPPAPELTPPEVPEPVVAKDSVTQEPPLAITTDYDTEYKDPLMELVTDPRILGVGALIIVFLGVLFGIRSWRNRRTDLGLDTLSQDMTSVFPGEATSIFGDNVGQSVDTSASSVIHTDFSQTGLSIDTNEGVDPVAEADVYMAYGRDSQAEEILNDALKTDPKRGAIYVKLLEIYAQRQDLSQFEATASELFSRTEGQGRDWEKAAQMGRRLDPSNPLYSSGPFKREKGGVSMLSGLEPGLEEPSKLDMGVQAGSAGSAPALSDLDFGTSTPKMRAPAADAGQLKDTMAVQGQINDMLSTRVVSGTIPGEQKSPPPLIETPDDDALSDVDFQFEPAEDTPKAAGSIDFDLGKQQPVSEMGSLPSEVGKQPISVTMSKKSASPGKSSRSLTGSIDAIVGATSKKVGIKTSSPKVAKDMAGPLDFDSPTQGKKSTGVAANMAKTAVMPSMRDGNAGNDEVTLDLEKTGFDPNMLDFDLDLDVRKSELAALSSTSLPAIGELDDAFEVGEIDTKLELALAYRDMGDNEGALELLREVVAQGNAAQKAEAKALIANLG